MMHTFIHLCLAFTNLGLLAALYYTNRSLDDLTDMILSSHEIDIIQNTMIDRQNDMIVSQNERITELSDHVLFISKLQSGEKNETGIPAMAKDTEVGK